MATDLAFHPPDTLGRPSWRIYPARALEGGVGLIAQSDSVIAFDSFSVRVHRP